MNIIELQHHFDEEENLEWIYYDKPYYVKGEKNRKIQEYFERIMRKNIYDNPDLENKKIQTEDIPVTFKEDKLLQKIGNPGEIIRHEFINNNIDEEKPHIIYGLKTNFKGEIGIKIGGYPVNEYKVEKNETLYLGVPLFVKFLKYHDLSIYVKSTNISGVKTEIKLLGIRIEELGFIQIKDIRFQIQSNIYMSGKFGKIMGLKEDVVIKDVYEDYPFIGKMIVDNKTFTTIHLSLDNMKIIEFHKNNLLGKKRIIQRTKKMKEELIRKTWHPKRVEDWCLPINVY